ncbi:substrate-binding protein-like domain-containing protein [Chitinophaga jiangningensis]|uniref:Substrate-binding protein-like domain-containing protein n=1 Tax=Chitinophaga jiangningensis TaxID=1419482 RepID=A0A1M6YY34_9BACT|nr:substrate-binding domain-containing protein [Chitinophaga jiangningensis]SHL23107.1 substrate-binding protein-like domain-containing protein [Chitinophaga jiangningensis]
MIKQHPLFKYIYIDDFSVTPKYFQLANSIIKSIADGKLQQDDIMPSINEVSCVFDISRDTAEKAYKYLKGLGILGSVPGKGYFIKHTNLGKQFKILLLFNKLSEHKKIIYDSFADKLGEQASIDFYIYNSDFGLFRKLLSQNLDAYTHVVILPHFRERWDNVDEVVNSIPKEKLILLDKKLKGVTGDYGAVYENFQEDIISVLEQAKDRLQKYQTIKIIFPDHSYYPEEIQQGFLQFCQNYAFQYEIVKDIDKETINRGDVYINMRESDLVTLIEKIISLDLVIGKDVGIISYNETPLKKLILNGLTTISTDFKYMGETAAQLILENTTAQIEVPFYLTMRQSL